METRLPKESRTFARQLFRLVSNLAELSARLSQLIDVWA